MRREKRGHWIVRGKYAREAAATLLRFAKSTSDPNLTAALVEKAADLNERGEDLSLSSKDESGTAAREQKQ
ncbi:hypothetical protein J6497_10395 [Bradyrhizobium sp. CNPSo 4026]|nr:hypothetical protein [Bradyrhizobium cenepequi]